MLLSGGHVGSRELHLKLITRPVWEEVFSQDGDGTGVISDAPKQGKNEATKYWIFCFTNAFKRNRSNKSKMRHQKTLC